MYIIGMALLPSVLLAVWIYFKDKQRKEPVFDLLKAFSLGVVSAGLTIVIHILMPEQIAAFIDGTAFWRAFVSAGVLEEFSKLLMFFLGIWSLKAFDERFDGIVYMAYIGLGFAFFENIFYLLDSTDAFSLFLGRALFSVPVHFFFAVLMGYFLGKAKFETTVAKRDFLIVFGWLLAVLAHGCYDYLLMRQEEVADAGAVVFLLQISFYVFDYFLWRIALRRIRRLQELDEEMGISPEQPDDIDWRRIPPKV